jgi:hypothetical protein
MAGEASLFKVRGQYAPERGLKACGLFFGKAKREREAVLGGCVKIAGFNEARDRQRQAVQGVDAQQETDSVAIAADRGLDGKFLDWRAGHLHSILEFSGGFFERVLNIGLRAFGALLPVVWGKARGGSLPGAGHVCAGLLDGNIAMAADACLAPYVAASISICQGGRYQEQQEQKRDSHILIVTQRRKGAKRFWDWVRVACSAFGLVRLRRFGSGLAEQQFDAVCGPRGYTRSEEVRILSPDGTFERERRGEDRPILFIASFQTLARFRFKPPVYVDIDTTNQLQQFAEHRQRRFRVDAPFQEDFREMFARFGNSRIWSEESRPRKVNLQNVANTPAENCANQYVRVKNDHFRPGSWEAGGALA